MGGRTGTRGAGDTTGLGTPSGGENPEGGHAGSCRPCEGAHPIARTGMPEGFTRPFRADPFRPVLEPHRTTGRGHDRMRRCTP
ncbi:hypothetical protein CRV15_35155 (plasmid) [Streptomyces clavuligerus]|uniref:Uncharacterized protein n=2 Tax=Streptomyces clavuligerus TaxID=1901 RepID=B5GLS0_STRCL|nr:hypothetical protein SSCG_00294 [Streptomyces clavuligerus]EFG04929.1 Hypothetical protein SCLAV_p1447 [Streptomyces clavuligerus]QCS10759.1 hypothetical protein CRV15_35155 [Streptomyces clavuligerus]QPJ97206.1 hypothetical protein GE265_29330 [Streptomyces clavuligerus]